MCAIHSAAVSRRVFSSMLAGGVVGLSFGRAHAAGSVAALVVTCIDYRLVDDATRFFDGMKLTNNYDLVSLAGATLAATSNKFPSSNAAFWDHIGIAKQLHNIGKVILLDHRDCGAYRVALNAPVNMARDPETAMHKKEMDTLKAEIAKRHPDLASEFYLMDLDGKTARIV
jgi:carbonic anhydrase